MHWETKKILCDSLYCNACFIAMVWNQTRNISVVSLCVYSVVPERNLVNEMIPSPFPAPLIGSKHRKSVQLRCGEQRSCLRDGQKAPEMTAR